MRQQKKPNEKERNYSIWFTGLILILVYMILLEDASGTEKSACKSILKERVLVEAEYVLEMSQEKEEGILPDLEEKSGIESWQPE